MSLRTGNIWSDPLVIGPVPVRQLLVPAGQLELAEDGQDLRVAGPTGSWPATTAGGEPRSLTARVPVVDRGSGQISWIGPRAASSPEEVLESFAGAIGFQHWDDPDSLRRPQIGALHAVIGHWSSGIGDPGLVVMPTGTGKTETMLAVLVAQRPARVLVVVPTDALRTQISAKFQRLGVLQREGIVAPRAQRPLVATLERAITDPEQAAALMAACNVVVATPAVLRYCSPEAQERLVERATHLFVDEAHHAPANTWASVIDSFAGKPVLLFTATPQREDGRAIPGRTIFRFPLREAQKDGYFTTIEHHAVVSLSGADDAIAQQAVARLERDRAAGMDHVLMARARSIARAEEIVELYRERAPHFSPRVLHQRLPAPRRKETLAALEARTTRVIVCVDMLGEGFDLPALKIAAIHDAKKSLSPLVQFIGRFTRTSSDAPIGTASVFIVRDPKLAATPMRSLLREDADWNVLLRDMTDRVARDVEQLQEFDASFGGVPQDVPMTLLAPKMSAIAHRSASPDWEPDRALAFFGEDRVLGRQVAVGADGLVAWLVVEKHGDVRWGDLPELQEVAYELIIMYFQPETGVLCIHGSDNTSSYNDLAVAVLGENTEVIAGVTTFRVFFDVARLTPTNVGLLDVRDHFNRYSMHVGSDVGEAINDPLRQGRSQTHIASSGFEDGEKVSISASLGGRFWSARSAINLKAWVDWCTHQSRKLIDSRVDIEAVLSGFIVPVDIVERPELVLLGLEWPWELYLGHTDGPTVSRDASPAPVVDIEFSVDDHSRTGPLKFSLLTDDWTIPYRADFVSSRGLVYTALQDDATIQGRHPMPLAQWMNTNKPTLFFEGDRLLTGQDRLLAPREELPPFDPRRLTCLDWTGVDITVESQMQRVDSEDRYRADSVQAHTSWLLRHHNNFAVLVDDDRAGEAADLVGLAAVEGWLYVTLVHCKYSSSAVPGARLADLYELCGQAVRGARWRQHGAVPLLAHLQRRVERYARRTGRSAFEVGELANLVELREQAPQLRPRFRTVLVQPGLSRRACGSEHLRLLAGAQSYVHALTKGDFEVWCSA